MNLPRVLKHSSTNRQNGRPFLLEEMETIVQHDDADKRAKIEKGKRLLDRYVYVCGSAQDVVVWGRVRGVDG